MKPPTRTKRRTILWIKPGRFLRIPLNFLGGSTWRSGDVVIFEVVGDSIHLFKPPTETVWRIERHRRRLNRARVDDSPALATRTYGEYRRMIRSSPDVRLINKLESQR